MIKAGRISLVLAFLLITCAAYAHPPTEIRLSFNRQTKTLSGVVEHYTSNPASHYIKKVDIAIGGEEVQTLYFSRQEKRESQSFQCKLPSVKDRDTVSAEAYCSISGKLMESMTVNI